MTSILNIKEKGYRVFYHGSSKLFRQPNITFSKGGDFGKGLYLTESYSMAKKWAVIQRYRRQSQKAYILAFGIPNDVLETCNGLYFDDVSLEWLCTIVTCRNLWQGISKRPIKIQDPESFDIISGPTADAKATQVLLAYVRSFKYGYCKDTKEVIDNLKTQNLSYQYCVKSDRLLKSIKYIGNEVIL